MLAHFSRPLFLVACASHLVFAAIGTAALEAHSPLTDTVSLFGGALSFVIAAALGLMILQDMSGLHRGWIKAALVFLVLGPLAYWGIQWPAVAETACIDNCHAAADYQRMLGDIVQSQMAMTAIALAALVCAARTTTAILDELAV